MKWPKRTLAVLAALLAIAAAVPFFISLDDYIPRIEKEASARLAEPVSIKRVRFSALPLPHVTIEGISVGATGDVSIGSVVVTPGLFSLMQSTKVIRRIEIDALVLTPKAIEKIPAWTRPQAAQSPRAAAQVRVESIRLKNALVDFGKASFGPFDARISLGSDGAAQEASIATVDGKLKALIKPDHAEYLLELSAKSWTLPAGPALVFDELTVKGVASSADLKLGEISAKLYGGTASGNAALNWRKGLQLAGKLDVRRLEMRQVATLLSPGTRISGTLDAQPVFSASAKSAAQLMHALRLATRFEVKNGTLLGVDIEKAATQLFKQASSGGETRFEQLSGHLLLERGDYRFTQLKIASGALAADGHVTISAKKELSGRINAEVKAAGASTGVPLNVAGTLDAPLLYPTGGTMAGAAAGTAIMGPGIGTTMGAKVGGWVEGLFDKKDPGKPAK
ncbi:MAG: AsmA family protein [Burkholderiales bacterium]|nr:AsmA family protein [Burkholderiales bacterium]